MDSSFHNGKWDKVEGFSRNLRNPSNGKEKGVQSGNWRSYRGQIILMGLSLAAGANLHHYQIARYYLIIFHYVL